MTRIHPVDQVDAPDLETAIDVLHRRGMRASTARRLVLEVLYAADRPLSVEQIIDGGRVPRSDQASVYRNLEVLERAGLVRHVHLGHGPGLYATTCGRPREYVICEACGAVRALDAERLDGVRELIRRALGHEARFTHFPLGGLCRDCAAQLPVTAGSQTATHAHS